LGLELGAAVERPSLASLITSMLNSAKRMVIRLPKTTRGPLGAKRPLPRPIITESLDQFQKTDEIQFREVRKDSIRPSKNQGNKPIPSRDEVALGRKLVVWESPLKMSPLIEEVFPSTSSSSPILSLLYGEEISVRLKRPQLPV
jgi:hypothetical protein